MKKLHPLAIALVASLCCWNLQAQDQPAAAPATTPSAPPATDAATAAKPIDPAKVTEIRRLLELTDTMKLTKQALEQMLGSFKSHYPDAPAGFWEKVEKDADLEALIAKVIPVYDKYYSLDDLKAVNAFYETPAGKRMVSVSPEIMGQSMQIAQDWGRGIAMKIQDDLAKAKEKNAPPATAPATAPAADAPAPAPTPVPATPATDDKK